MYCYRFLVRYPLFIPIFMLLLLVVNAYHVAVAVTGGFVAEHRVLLSLNALITFAAIVFLVLVYRRRAWLTAPVTLTETHIHAVIMPVKKQPFTQGGHYQAVPWDAILGLEAFAPTSSQGRLLGEREGFELLTGQGSILVWSAIGGYQELKNTVLAKTRFSAE